MVGLVQRERRKGELHPSPGLSPTPVATSLGDQLNAAVMSVHTAVGTLDPLLHYAVEECTAVVAPCGLVVRVTLEIVGVWLLEIKFARSYILSYRTV